MHSSVSSFSILIYHTFSQILRNKSEKFSIRFILCDSIPYDFLVFKHVNIYFIMAFHFFYYHDIYIREEKKMKKKKEKKIIRDFVLLMKRPKY